MPKVLILDNSDSNLAQYARIVAQVGGAEAITFKDPSEAIAWAGGSSGTDPWLTIVEHNMPAPGGINFVPLFRAIRGKNDVPVIVISENGDRDLRREVLRMGGNMTLSKPIDPVEFLAIITGLLTQRQAHLQVAQQAAGYAQQVRLLTERCSIYEKDLALLMQRSVEARDKRSAQHLMRVGSYSEKIAAAMGMSAADIEMIALAASLHDIGKLAIPDRIYFKNGKLLQSEREIVRSHVQAGFDLLKDGTSPLAKAAAPIALSHHERYDGSGYPKGLRGDAIPPFARIVAVADVFAAVTSHRPQREALPVNVGIEEIERHRGTHFEPAVVDAFKTCLPDIMEARRSVPDLLAARV